MAKRLTMTIDVGDDASDDAEKVARVILSAAGLGRNANAASDDLLGFEVFTPTLVEAWWRDAREGVDVGRRMKL
jgi:hypothetical protein